MFEANTKDILEAQNNNEEAMEKVIINNSGLVWSIVNRFLGRGYSKEELYQIGCIGLIKAIKRFDVTFEVKLSTFAVPYIMGEIKRFIRDDGPIKVSRSIKELGSKIRELQREYFTKNGEDIRISEMAKILGVKKEDITIALDAARPIDSIDEEAYKGEESQTKISKIGNNKDEVGDLINKITLNKIINDLDKKEKEIVLLRYFKDKTQTQVANMLGISQVQVSRIEKKILIELREKLIS